MTTLQAVPRERAEMSYDFWDRTVLVVEPDEVVRKNARRILVEHGMTVFEASGAVEALEMLADEFIEPDLLIQDLKVADMVGLHLARTMRSIRPDLPILFMSAYVDGASTGAAFQQEGWSFLDKPFSAPALLEECAAALEPGIPN